MTTAHDGSEKHFVAVTDENPQTKLKRFFNSSARLILG
jgi:hypothetical protein